MAENVRMILSLDVKVKSKDYNYEDARKLSAAVETALKENFYIFDDVFPEEALVHLYVNSMYSAEE